MNRRGFLGSILALGAAPAIVRADSLMRIVPVQSTILLPGAWRELSQYDIRVDAMIHRFDVACEIQGQITQLTATLQMPVSLHYRDHFQSGESAAMQQARRDAIFMLQRRMAVEGGKPVRGILKIPAALSAKEAWFL